MRGASAAWGFRRRLSRPLFGVTCLRPAGGAPLPDPGRFDPVGEFAMYRFHLHDWVNFRRSLKMQFANGAAARGESGARLELRSVAFWYGRALADEPDA